MTSRRRSCGCVRMTPASTPETRCASTPARACASGDGEREGSETVRGLRGKVAVVTGATQTMGEAIARRLAAEGARVVGFGRSAERGHAVAERITADGGSATFVEGDITDDSDVHALVDRAMASFGRLDVVVNN